MKTQRKKTLDYESAYQTAVRLLGSRAHSRQEIAQKLRQRGYSQPVIALVLERCSERRYIDDAATCDGYCRELIRKGFGPLAVRQRLSARGIAGELIQSTLEDRYPFEVVCTTARAVAARKLRQLSGRFRDEIDIRTRLARFLDQRGFPATIIREILEGRLDDDST